MANDILDYCELYPTIKSGNDSAGTPVLVIRLFGTNISDKNEKRQFTVDANLAVTKQLRKKLKASDILEEIKKIGSVANYNWLICGGEPLLQQEALAELIRLFTENFNKSPFIQLETNGTIQPEEYFNSLINKYHVYLRLANSMDGSNISTFAARIKEVPIKFFVNMSAENRADFNFLIKDMTDVKDMEELLSLFKISANKVWLTPFFQLFSSFLTISAPIRNVCIAKGYNFSMPTDQLLFNGRPNS